MAPIAVNFSHFFITVPQAAGSCFNSAEPACGQSGKFPVRR
jgi:hypothetical protein